MSEKIIGITVEELIKLYEQQGLPNKDTGIKKAIAAAISLAATRVYVALTTKTDDLEGRINMLAEVAAELTQAVNKTELSRQNTQPARRGTAARVCYCGTHVLGERCDVCGRS